MTKIERYGILLLLTIITITFVLITHFMGLLVL